MPAGSGQAPSSLGGGQAPSFGRVVIAGVGLMGGSLGMALRLRGLASRVIGCDPDRSALEEALRLGAIDEPAPLASAARDADLVVLAAPVPAFPHLLTALAGAVPPEAVLTDLGSVKRPVLNAATVLPRPQRFVGGHPVAGKETAGVQSANPTLFQDHAFAVVPPPGADADAVQRVWALAEALGARPLLLDAEEHDRLVAGVSHLPQVAAYALAAAVWDAVAGPLDSPAAARILAGAGYRDTTRLANSPPELWRDLALANREHLLPSLASLRQHLDAMAQALEAEDGEALEVLFRGGRAGRVALTE